MARHARRLVAFVAFVAVITAASRATDEALANYTHRWRYAKSQFAKETRCPRHRRPFCKNSLAKVGPVDVACRVEVAATGFKGTLPRTLVVVEGTRQGWRTFRGVRDDPATLAMPSLCAYGVSGPPRQAGVVGLVAASSLAYLFREWAAFVNKVAYFSAARLDWSLWLGDLDDALATTVEAACARRPESLGTVRVKASDSLYVGDAARANSNHLVKVVAAYALLDRPGVTGVAYVDMDAMAPRPAIDAAARRAAPLAVFSPVPGGRRRLRWSDAAWTKWLDALKRGAPEPSFRQPRPAWWSRSAGGGFWQTKSMRFYVDAREELSFEILGRWLGNRCGFKDQLALWHSLLQVAASRDCLRAPRDADGAPTAKRPYEDEIFRLDYAAARGYPNRTAPALRPGEHEDPLLTTCAEVKRRCPALDVCDDGTADLLGDFGHRTVAGDRTRAFSLVDDFGRRWSFAVPDSERVEPPYARLGSNGDFVRYFGLDRVGVAD